MHSTDELEVFSACMFVLHFRFWKLKGDFFLLFSERQEEGSDFCLRKKSEGTPERDVSSQVLSTLQRVWLA